MMFKVFSGGATMVTETWFAMFLFLSLLKVGSMDKGMLFIVLSKNFPALDT